MTLRLLSANLKTNVHPIIIIDKVNLMIIGIIQQCKEIQFSTIFSMKLLYLFIFKFKRGFPKI